MLRCQGSCVAAKPSNLARSTSKSRAVETLPWCGNQYDTPAIVRFCFWSLDTVVPRNEFLCTTKTFDHFELTVKFKLLGDKDKANGGVQFRTKRIPKHHEVSGYQADIGQGYWGALYDESRRNKVLAGPKAADLPKIIKPDDWNEYKIRAEGPHIQLWLNGTKTVDYTEDDPKAEQTGVIGLQVHGGGKSKVLYKDIAIEELPAPKK